MDFTGALIIPVILYLVQQIISHVMHNDQLIELKKQTELLELLIKDKPKHHDI